MNSITVCSIVATLTICLAPSGNAQTKNVTNASNAPTASSTSSNEAAKYSDDFLIGPGDVLAINVWKEAEISRIVPVRPDGRISLPLIGELQSSGQTPKQLEAEITKRLKDFVADPSVTVVVQEIRSQKFNVLGMVTHPGSYPLAKPMTVVDAIATAGGFRDFAKQRDIYVLRHDPSGKQTRLPFNYKDVIKGLHPEQNVELQTSDTVVVP
jgi:polysaccharide export outer membrane protein